MLWLSALVATKVRNSSHTSREPKYGLEPNSRAVLYITGNTTDQLWSPVASKSPVMSFTELQIAQSPIQPSNQGTINPPIPVT